MTKIQMHTRLHRLFRERKISDALFELMYNIITSNKSADAQAKLSQYSDYFKRRKYNGV